MSNSNGNDISDNNSRPAPGVFHKYFYNHARRLRLEKLLYLECFLDVAVPVADIFNRFWIQDPGGLEVKRLHVIYSGYM
jgi:hypothetical protein